MSANPWMKFYPSDWRSDPRLKAVSRAARSLWLDMICLMHEADRYGDLTINGRPLDAEKLAQIVGDCVEDVTTWLAELEAAGVYSVRKNGTIYSRRMERDENKRRKLRENGKKGGNPKLCKQSGNEPLLIQEDKATEARSQKPDTRVPTSSDEASPVPEDDRTILFREGLNFIKSRGIPERQARSLLGKCLQLCGDDATAVLEAVREAYRTRPAELQPWLLSRFKAKPKSQRFDRWAGVGDPNRDPFADEVPPSSDPFEGLDLGNVVAFGGRS